MKIKYLRYWFSSLPFFEAIKYSCIYLSNRFFNKDIGVYFSQTGEDIIIKNLLGNKESGFYVDVGCHHPTRISNTFGLYLNGWKGVCIDANQNLTEKFQKVRLNDIVIHALISDIEEEQVYIEYQKEAFNAIGSLLAADAGNIKSMRKFNTKRLEDILDEHNASIKSFDLLTIDVEGYELKVLKSLNIDKYRPTLICVEIHNFNLNKPGSSEIYNYLILNDYSLSGYVAMNAYFKNNRK